MATETIGEPLFGDGDTIILYHRQGGAWTTHINPTYIDKLSEQMAAERFADGERILAKPVERFLHWLFQTPLWKEHRVAR